MAGECNPSESTTACNLEYFSFLRAPVNADFQTFSTQSPAMKAARATETVAATIPSPISVSTSTILASVSSMTVPQLSSARRTSSTKAARAIRVVWTLPTLLKQSAMERTPGACNPCIDTKVPCTCNDGGSCEINYLSRGTVCDAADAGITLGVCEIGKCGGKTINALREVSRRARLASQITMFSAPMRARATDPVFALQSDAPSSRQSTPVGSWVNRARIGLRKLLEFAALTPSSSTIILQCVDAPCPCGTCTSKSNGKNIAYCTNDGAAASEACDNSCGSCTTGNGEGLEPMPNPPFFTGAACANANSCDRKTFIPALLPGSNPNKFCPGSQSCVTCKDESISRGQGCCLASSSGSADPAEPCP